ncbi:MAG: phage tail protein [Leptolyngbyaceae bacterium]|nr:phage tail protein [Leptolyngbyaceae bacterium]
MADEPIRGKNYVSTNRFYIEMESTIKASFSECSSIGMEIASEPHEEGGVNDQVRLVLGKPKFDPITLKRGVTNDLMFWEWLKNVLDPTKKIERRNINIVVFNQAGETMQCWTLIGAVPTAWKAPAMQASQNEIAVEELTLGYEGLQVSDSQSGGAQIHSQGRDELGYFTAAKN